MLLLGSNDGSLSRKYSTKADISDFAAVALKDAIRPANTW